MSVRLKALHAQLEINQIHKIGVYAGYAGNTILIKIAVSAVVVS